MDLEKAATKADLQDLAKTLGGKFDQIDGKFDQLIEFMRGIETNLLREFHHYAKGQTTRGQAVEFRTGSIETRLHEIEERVLELESRIRPKY